MSRNRSSSDRSATGTSAALLPSVYTVTTAANGSVPNSWTIHISRRDAAAFDVRYVEVPAGMTAAAPTGTAAPNYWSEVRFDFGASSSAVITAGSAWSVNLDGKTYTYTAGAGVDATLIDAIDITIADNDVLGVIVTQPGGSTDVTEPTDRAVLGGGKASSETVDEGAVLQLTVPAENPISSAEILVFSDGETQPTGRTTTSLSANQTTATFAFSGEAVTGETWYLRLNMGTIAVPKFADYRFEVGADTSLTAVAAGLQAKITAADVVYGTPVAYITAEANTVSQFKASFGSPILNSNHQNNAVFDAQNADYASWSDVSNPDLFDFDGTQPTESLMPHLTIKGSGTGDLDYYGFTVDETWNVGGSPLGTTATVAATFDIDHGYDYGDPQFWGSQLHLYKFDEVKKDYVLLTVGRGWSSPSEGGGGSGYWFDDFLTVDLTAGEYVIGVSNWLYWYNNYSTGIPEGVDYDLNISIENHPVSRFVFAPTPVQEDSALTATTTGQSLEDPDNSNWFTYFNPDIGNIVYGQSNSDVPIESSVPYTVVRGTGDGQRDSYTVTITPEMLSRPVPAPTDTTPDNHSYYENVTLTLTGGVKAGDKWTLTINGRNYEYLVQSADALTLGGVVTKLAALANAFDATTNPTGQKPADAPYEVTADAAAHTLTINDPTKSGVWFDLTHEVSNSAAVIKTGSLSAATTFNDATIGLQRTGSVQTGEIWTVKLVNAVTSVVNEKSYTWTGNEALGSGQTQLNYIADQLAGQLDDVTSYVTAAVGDGIHITNADGFSVEFTKLGTTSQGSASISGRPINASTAKWTDASFELQGAPSSYEDWTVTLNGVNYTHHVALGGESVDTVGSLTAGTGLAKQIHDAHVRASNPIAQDAAYDVSTHTLRIWSPSGLRADAFTAGVSVSAGAQGSVTESAASAVTHGVAMPASPSASETWQVTVVVETSGANAVLASGTASAASAGALATALATALNDSGSSTKLPSGYLATAAGSNLLVSNASGQTFEIGLAQLQAVESHGRTLTETVAAGQIWAVNILEGATTISTASYVAATGNNRTYIAEQLAAGLNSTAANGLPSGYTASFSGDSVIVSKASSSSSSFSVNVAARQSDDVSTTTTADVLTLTGGTVAVGSYWDIQLIDTDANIVRDVVNYRVGSAGMSPSDIVDAVLATPDLSYAGYSIVQDGARLIAVNTAGTSFDLKLSTATRNEVSASTPASTNWISTVTVDIASANYSSIAPGSTWRIELTQGNTYVASSTYTWLGTEDVGTGNNTAKAAAAGKLVAAGLAAKLSATGYDVIYTAGNNTFTVDGTAAFTITGTGFTFGSSSTPVSTDAVTVSSTSPTAGDVWGINLAQTNASAGSATADYIAKTDATTSAIVDALLADLGTLPAGVSVKKVGDTIVAYTSTSGATVALNAAPVATGYSSTTLQSVGLVSPTSATGVGVLMTGTTTASVINTAYPGSLAGLVTQLNTDLAAGYVASSDGTYLFINRVSVTPFNAWLTSNFSVTDTAVTLAAGTGGAGVTGEAWTVGVTGETGTGSYVTAQSSASVAKSLSEIAGELATSLDGALGTDYVVTAIGDKVVISRINGTAGTATGTYTAPAVPAGNKQVFSTRDSAAAMEPGHQSGKIR